MSKKSVFAIALFALVLAVAGSALTVQAASESQTCPSVYNDDEGVWVQGIYCDGRLNAFDVDQPVAIYYAREAQQFVDDDGNAYTGDAIVGIEFWAIDSTGQGQLALWVPVEQVKAALNSTSDVQIASQNGISLSYSPAVNALTATMGSYTFTWDAL